MHCISQLGCVWYTQISLLYVIIQNRHYPTGFETDFYLLSFFTVERKEEKNFEVAVICSHNKISSCMKRQLLPGDL